MKSTAVFFIAAFAAGLSWRVSGQMPTPPSYTTSPNVVGTTSKNASGAPASTSNNESNTAEHDDSLYRGKTSDMETTLLRDDGALHFKTHPKERIQNLDSLKSLQSSGIDAKFQGSFITSGVSSIDKVAEKGTAAELANQVAPQTEDQGDPRFARRHLVFTPQEDDKSKKVEADSSPSPTPSPATSPKAKKSSDSKQ